MLTHIVISLLVVPYRYCAVLQSLAAAAHWPCCEHSRVAIPYRCCAVLQCRCPLALQRALCLYNRDPLSNSGLIARSQSSSSVPLALSCRPLSDSCLMSSRVSQVRWLLPARSLCRPVRCFSALECLATHVPFETNVSFSQACAPHATLRPIFTSKCNEMGLRRHSDGDCLHALGEWQVQA